MKANKKRMCAAIVALVMILSVIMLGGCSAKTDWTTYSFEDYQKISFEEWDSKKIEYQFLNEYATEESGYGYYYPVVLNLCEDGSAVAWHGSITAGGHNPMWTDEEKMLLWAEYGYWTKEVKDGVTTLKIHLEAGNALEGDPMGGNVTATGAPVVHDYEASDALEKGTFILGAYNTFSSFKSDIPSAATCDGTVHFKSYQEFYDSWKANIAER